MKKLFNLVFMGITCISQVWAMDRVQPELEPVRYDIADSLFFVEFGECVGYESKNDAISGIRGRNIGLLAVCRYKNFAKRVVFPQERFCDRGWWIVKKSKKSRKLLATFLSSTELTQNLKDDFEDAEILDRMTKVLEICKKVKLVRRLLTSAMSSEEAACLSEMVAFCGMAKGIAHNLLRKKCLAIPDRGCAIIAFRLIRDIASYFDEILINVNSVWQDNFC